MQAMSSVLIRATRCIAWLVVLLANASSSFAAMTEITESRVCGGGGFALRQQREKSRPGLDAPEIFFDGRDRDSELDDSYLKAPGRNDVESSPFAVPVDRQLHPVAEQLALLCQEDQPGVLVRLLDWGDEESAAVRRSQRFIDYQRDDVVTPDSEYSAQTGDGEWLSRGEFATFLPGRNPRNPARQILTVGEEFTFEIVVDPSLAERLPEVEGLTENDPPRPVGRAQFGPGKVIEYVLDELMVLVPDDAALQAVLDRWDAELLDRSPLDREGRSVAQIRLSTSVLDQVDTSELASELLRIEPNHRGTLSLSSPALAQLFTVAVTEINQYGTVIAPNPLLQADSISTGSTQEHPTVPQGPDAFSWDFIREQSGMRTGVGRAWQVMDATVGFSEKVTVMIVDGGFTPNPDLALNTIVRKTQWGTPNPLDCSGTPCPWHGITSATTAAGRVDNGIGAAGPAGPVADVVLVGMSTEMYTTQRRARDMVAEYHPAVINMSFSRDNYAFRKATAAILDVYFKEMTNMGALIFASSGNDGMNVDAASSGEEDATTLPCESSYVVCVGGMSSGGQHNGGANYGTLLGSETVEIAGPMCTFGRVADTDDLNLDMKVVCGTSEASPFVAGVAALVKSANPSLSPTELRDLLFETAHTGAPYIPPLPGGYDRRVNAFDAVVSALGITLQPPSLTILKPKAYSQIGKQALLDVKAVAEDTFDRPLSIRWTSDRDGERAVTMSGGFTAISLSQGLHTLTATATDFRGVSTQKSVQVQVGAPAQITILSPEAGEDIYQQQQVAFVASSYDPDVFGPLDDDKVFWTVRKNGVDVWGAAGHYAVAPIYTFTAGVYEVIVHGVDIDGSAEDSSTFEVIDLPTGYAPGVQIVVPATNQKLQSLNGVAMSVLLQGTAVDAEDGPISGTRFRWTAVSDKGTKKTLCEGHQVPGSGDGGIVVPMDCSVVEVELGPDKTAVLTKWVITLEAWDSDDLSGKAQRTITIETTAG